MNISPLSVGNGGPLIPSVSNSAGIASNAAPAQSEPTPRADLGLLIEDDKAAGEMIYKTINKITGDVVDQFPSEQLVRLREASSYVPGGMVDKSA